MRRRSHGELASPRAACARRASGSARSASGRRERADRRRAPRTRSRSGTGAGSRARAMRGTIASNQLAHRRHVRARVAEALAACGSAARAPDRAAATPASPPRSISAQMYGPGRAISHSPARLDQIVQVLDVAQAGEVVLAGALAVEAPRVVDVDRVQPGVLHAARCGRARARARAAGSSAASPRGRSRAAVDAQAVAVEFDPQRLLVVAASQRSASRAAMQPVPAAVTAWR